MIRAKLCGITNLEDALLASSLGFYGLGFILAPSPRQVEPLEVERIVKVLPPLVVKVGVFVNEKREEVIRIAKRCSLHVLQLHGQESPAMCKELREEGFDVIKAISLKDEKSLALIPQYLEHGAQAILFDTYHPTMAGGTGELCSWDLASKGLKIALGRGILAGGLGPSNLMEAMKALSPRAVDINSGAEISPRKKDPEKMREIMEILQSYHREEGQ